MCIHNTFGPTVSMPLHWNVAGFVRLNLAVRKQEDKWVPFLGTYPQDNVGETRIVGDEPAGFPSISSSYTIHFKLFVFLVHLICNSYAPNKGNPRSPAILLSDFSSYKQLTYPSSHSNYWSICSLPVSLISKCSLLYASLVMSWGSASPEAQYISCSRLL